MPVYITVKYGESQANSSSHLETRGPGPGRSSRLFQENVFNEILVFDLSLAIGLYALTIYAMTVMGTRRRGISRSLRDVSD